MSDGGPSDPHHHPQHHRRRRQPRESSEHELARGHDQQPQGSASHRTHSWDTDPGRRPHIGHGQSHLPPTRSPAPSHWTQHPDSTVVTTHEVRASVNREINRRMINQYEFDQRVGRGQHGEVYLARDVSNGRMEVAIKVVRRKNPKQDKLAQLRKGRLPRQSHLPLTDQLGSTEYKIRKEIAIMKKCHHPHVVRLLEIIDDPLKQYIYMVMEYLGGGEIKWRTLEDEPVLRVDQTRRICRDVILGLEYLHHQGIIHRDIKPANLLWTSDRRTVKITDFGVSHFSYAQRLAAAGRGTIPADDTDPILMDDSDLSKTAGTPMFLAPEIVSDTTVLEASGSTSTLHLSTTAHSYTHAPGSLSSPSTPRGRGRRRQPITKAIDVWAFGVTLYGLLFGHLPFEAGTEYEIYQVILKHDWTVDATMGVDRLPTGGRHQKSLPKGQETECYLVMHLLERLLEKDAGKRITLDEVKRHPWILRDMENPQQWLRETTLDPSPTPEPTPDETSSAMSAVRFRWSARVARGVIDLMRNVKPQRSWWSSHNGREHDPEKYVGVQSAPNIHLSRRRSTTSAPYTHPVKDHDRSRGKRRASSRSSALRNESTTDVSVHKSILVSGPASNSAGPSSSVQIAGSGPKPRRGSFPSKMTLEVPNRPFRVGSPQPSPISISQASTPSGDGSQTGSGTVSPEDRPRSRLSLTSWVRNWRGKHPPAADATSNASSYAGALRTGVSGGEASRGRRGLARRSEDAFNSVAPSRRSTASGPLTVAMRAASWGEVTDYARPSEDMTSLYSGGHGDDALDDDTLLLGAGGVAQSPVPSIPSGLLSTASSLNLHSPTGSSCNIPSQQQPTISAAHAILQRTEVGETASAQDPAALDTSVLARQGQIRSRTTSPLAQEYNPDEVSIDVLLPYDSSGGADGDDFHSPDGDDSPDDSDSDAYDDHSSVFDDSHSHFDDEVALQPSTSEMYRREDESDDEEQVPLEIRTRRPSVSAVDIGSSPHRSGSRGLSADSAQHGARHRERERPMICT